MNRENGVMYIKARFSFLRLTKMVSIKLIP